VPAAPSSQAMPSIRPGEAAGEFTDVRGADQVAHGRVTRRRQCPIIAGCAAAPDPPLRVVAPEPLELGILVVPAEGRRSRRAKAGHGTAGSGRMSTGWPPGHGSYLPRGGLCGVGQPGARVRRRRADRPAQHRRDRCGAGLVRRHRQVPSPVRHGGPGRDPACKCGVRPRERPDPGRDEAVNQVSARRAGPVTRLPPARTRPAAMCQPVAVVRMAAMTIAVVPADPAACPALPWHASIERLPADSGLIVIVRRPVRHARRSAGSGLLRRYIRGASSPRDGNDAAPGTITPGLRCLPVFGGCGAGRVSGRSGPAAPWVCHDCRRR
jgi:hypothetical protein